MEARQPSTNEGSSQGKKTTQRRGGQTAVSGPVNHKEAIEAMGYTRHRQHVCGHPTSLHYTVSEAMENAILAELCVDCKTKEKQK